MTTKLVILVAASVLMDSAHSVIPTGSIALQVLAQRPQFAGLFCSPSRNAGWGVPLPESQNSRWKHMRLLATAQPANAEGCADYTLADLAASSTARQLASQGDHDHEHVAHETHDNTIIAATTRTKVNLSTLVIADRGNCSFVHKALVAQRAGAKGLIVRATRKATYEAILAARNGSARTNTTMTAAPPSTPAPPFDYDCSRGESFVPALAEPVWATDDAACHRQCASLMCIPTGEIDAERGGHQLCCLWDTYVLMGVNASSESNATNVTIPVVFVTIADGATLARALSHYPTLLVRTFARDVPLVDVASVLLWAIGVATAIGASYYAAAADRKQWRLRRADDVDVEAPPAVAGQSPQQAPHDNDVWEIDTRHAVGFIVCAGVFLVVCYFVKLGGVVPILFSLAAAGTLTQLVFAPLLDYTVPAIASRQLTVCSDTIALSEVVGLALSAALAVVWYVYRRTCWFLQDVFGIALCFVFLSTVQLPNLKVATLLLTLAFVYDVFFVFLTPALFGRSVMEDVATGGPAAYTRSDYPGIDYCERYPLFAPCMDPEPMPMLLVLPRVFDWVGGVSMLGLGDVILPGLLLAYALRFDYSTQSRGEHYYRTVCVGYAIGLAMANVAVSVMQMGQPALLYIVPTTLGTLVVLAWRNGDLKAMWTGFDRYDDNSASDAKRSDQQEEEEEHCDNDVSDCERAGGRRFQHASRAGGGHPVVQDSAPLLGLSSSP